jgi:serine O-acetyltransferase
MGRNGMSGDEARPSQWRCLRADFERYLELTPGWPRHSWLVRARVAITTEPYWVLFWYRFGRWATIECRVPGVQQLCLLLYHVMFRTLRLLTGISISRQCDAGPGLFFGHFGTLWINPGVRIGHHVAIAQGVTLGEAGEGAQWGVPEIGNHVFIGPNATVVGKLRIGNGCVIGANTLVVSDVPDGTTVLGVPARIVARGGNQVARFAAADKTEATPEPR